MAITVLITTLLAYIISLQLFFHKCFKFELALIANEKELFRSSSFAMSSALKKVNLFEILLLQS